MFLHFGISKMTMQQKIDIVLNAFKSGKQVLIFTDNNSIILSNTLHCEVQLISYLKQANTVRII